MSEDKKQQLLNKLASCSLLIGGVATGMPGSADASAIDGYTALGSGSQVRSDILGGKLEVPTRELKDEEGKCGEGSCGDDKDGGEGKCGEGSCGDGHE